MLGKKIKKNDFAPSEKYSSNAPEYKLASPHLMISSLSEGIFDFFFYIKYVNSPGGYSSMISVETCHWDLKSRPIFIPNFT